MQSEFFRDLNNEQPLQLKDSDFKVWSSFTDPTFNNDDSEFAEIRLHYYNNNNTLDGVSPNEEVRMKECAIDGMDLDA
jgi:hypothetical protein